MRAFARIVLCGALATGLFLGVAGTAHAANYMYAKPLAEQLLDSQKREADLAKELAQAEAANTALASQVEAANELNKSLSEENAGLTSRLSSSESSLAALVATSESGKKQVSTLESEIARLRQAPTAGPFDFSDSGHALVALTALLIGIVVTAGAAYAISRKRSAGDTPVTEPVSPQ